MIPTHGPEHIWTVVAIVGTLYGVLLVWLGRLLRKRRRAPLEMKELTAEQWDAYMKLVESVSEPINSTGGAEDGG